MRAVLQPESVSRRMQEIASTALLWGFDALELRSVGGAEDWIPYVSERAIVSACREAELDVAAVDPGYFAGSAEERAAWMNELAMLPEVARVCERIGCSGILLGSLGSSGESGDRMSDALERIVRDAERISGRTGIRFLMRTGTAYSGLADVLRAIDAVGATHVHPVLELAIAPMSTMPDVPDLPPDAGRAAYARVDYRGTDAVSPAAASDLASAFRTVAARLRATGFDSDVCLEFEKRPDSVSGLRVSTAFVSAFGAG